MTKVLFPPLDKFQWSRTALKRHQNHENEEKRGEWKLTAATYEKEPTPKGDHENKLQRQFSFFIFIDSQ